jgi:hypothetical protein
MQNFRFSLRTLAIAIGVIAMGCALVVRSEAFQQRLLARRLHSAGVRSVHIPMDYSGCGFGVLSRTNIAIGADGSTRLDEVNALVPPRKWIFVSVEGSQLSPDWLKSLRRCDKTIRLNFSKTDISDSGLIHLRGMPALEILDLDGASVTDKSVANFTSMPSLQAVSLRGTSVTESGIDELLRAGIEVVAPDGTHRTLDNPNDNDDLPTAPPRRGRSGIAVRR